MASRPAASRASAAPPSAVKSKKSSPATQPKAKIDPAVKQAQVTAALYARVAVGEGPQLDGDAFRAALLKGFKYAVDKIWQVHINKTERDDLDDVEKYAFGFNFADHTQKQVLGCATLRSFPHVCSVLVTHFSEFSSCSRVY
jgi:hypothetical protein